MPLRFWPPAILTILLSVAAGGLAWSGIPPVGILALCLAGGLTLALLHVAMTQATGDDILPPKVPTEPELPQPNRDFLEHIPAPLILIEPGGRISFANRPALEIFPRLAHAQHFASLLRAPAFVDAVTAAFATGRAQAIDFALFHGGELHLRAHVCPTDRPEGEERPGPVIVLVQDRTADVRIEALRSDFVANASHEMRTPLASIIGSIETLRGPARDDTTARERFLEIMSRQAERMKRLVEDLLSLSQIELSEHVAPREDCDLYDAAREALAALSPLQKRREMQIDPKLPTGPCPVRGDRDQLIQVFVNLLENAMKYAGKSGPIEIVVPEPDMRHPGMTGVSIVDRGPGIAREHVPRLTERFYRVSPQVSREQGGTGLGLAIVKHVLNRHRGALQIESAPGRGSRFTVWLPQPKARAEAVSSSENLEKIN